ncbi:hypothetical protein [Ralstonia sp. UBA689]|uniref:hypothetical protein n=1 Tax=Ralstonia sp. UBA689 TaxID=1947373 RepID=UPI0025E786DF|nr:hypothetical protein [Ralstonia sp. UBA689]
MKACLSLASWRGLDYARVPQTVGVLNEAHVDALLAGFPGIQFRLHANVRVLPRHRLADLSTFDADLDWFQQAARISQRLSAPAYSAHAGYRHNATLSQVLNNTRRCADLFGCPVAVEGLYPDRHDAQLVSTWEEYRTVFASGVPYALDLSHLFIVAHRYGREDGLVVDMLACERCIEVHVSDNDGSGDWHRVCHEPPWWYRLLAYLHPDAVVFSEGNHRRASEEN